MLLRQLLGADINEALGWSQSNDTVIVVHPAERTTTRITLTRPAG